MWLLAEDSKHSVAITTRIVRLARVRAGTFRTKHYAHNRPTFPQIGGCTYSTPPPSKGSADVHHRPTRPPAPRSRHGHRRGGRVRSRSPGGHGGRAQPS